jgi:hypothetical protein
LHFHINQNQFDKPLAFVLLFLEQVFVIYQLLDPDHREISNTNIPENKVLSLFNKIYLLGKHLYNPVFVN